MHCLLPHDSVVLPLYITLYCHHSLCTAIIHYSVLPGSHDTLYCIGVETGGGGGGAVGACAPILFYLGGQCPHKIWVANRTIRRNAYTPPPVCSIIVHVDMVFCGEGTVKGWRTIEFAMISTAQSERSRSRVSYCRAYFIRTHAHRRPHNHDWIPPPMYCHHTSLCIIILPSYITLYCHHIHTS